jgi:hypothetical protein
MDCAIGYYTATAAGKRPLVGGYTAHHTAYPSQYAVPEEEDPEEEEDVKDDEEEEHVITAGVLPNQPIVSADPSLDIDPALFQDYNVLAQGRIRGSAGFTNQFLDSRKLPKLTPHSFKLMEKCSTCVRSRISSLS